MKILDRFFASLTWKRFVAKYVRYLELWGYFNVLAVGTGVVIAWVWTVDVTADSNNGYLEAHEHALTLSEPCVVLRLPVGDKSDVEKGQVVAEVVTGRRAVESARLRAEVRRTLETLDAAAGGGEADENRRRLREALRASLSAGDAGGTVVRLTAPCDGMLWLGKCREGNVYEAGQRIAGVKDFDRLEANLLFEKKNTFLCRPGLRASLEILPAQPFEVLVRLEGDTRPGVPLAGNRQDSFSSVDQKRLRAMLEESLAGTELLDSDPRSEGDFELPLSKLENVTFFLESDVKVGGGSAPGAAALRPESFRGRALPAVVASGVHTASYTMVGLKPELEEKLAEALSAELVGRRVEVDGETGYSVEKLGKLTVSVEADGRMKMKDWDLAASPRGMSPGEIPYPAAEFRKGRGSDLVNRRSREFRGALVLVDPEPELKELVRRLTRQGVRLKVKGYVVVDRTRFAMRLFRKH